MSELIQLIQEADLALLNVEQSRLAIEAAKVALELAKNDHDRAKGQFEEVLARADEVGVSRAKLRKIIEERALVLSASGLLSVPVNKLAANAKVVKATPKKAAKPREQKRSDPFEEVVLENEHLESQEAVLNA